MKKRKTIQFKVNGKVMAELRGDVYLNQIDEFCWVIASECEVPIDDVNPEIVEGNLDISDIDVTPDGLMVWTDVMGKIITGIKCDFELGSDIHLDTIVNNSITDHLHFN